VEAEIAPQNSNRMKITHFALQTGEPAGRDLQHHVAEEERAGGETDGGAPQAELCRIAGIAIAMLVRSIIEMIASRPP
jgi:hypothetical protein